MSFPDGFARTGRSQEDYYSQSELMTLLNLNEAQLRALGTGVVVAVIDTGVDLSHPELAGRLWSDLRSGADLPNDGIDNDNDGLIDDSHGWDFVDNDANPGESAGDPEQTVSGHGTFISGLIALVAPECRILPVRAFYEDGTSDAFTVAQAIKYAADHGAQVINLSFGSSEAPQVMIDAMDYAHQKGAVLVAAVGNENTEGNPQFPATFLDSLAVAAIDLESKKAPFSNFGAEVDVDAPGLALTSTYPSNPDQPAAYALWSGTSFAAPFASAQAALILDIGPRHNARQVIEATATSIDEYNPGYAGKLGKGRIDLLEAVERVLADETVLGNYKTTRLQPATAGTTPAGVAMIGVVGPKQKLLIGAGGLRPHAIYHISINGVALASLAATSLGGIRIEFTNEATGANSLPEFLNPVTNARRITVRDSLGQDVLLGDFASAQAPAKPVDQIDEKQAALISTGLLVRTGGIAKSEVNSERERFKVEASGLEPNAFYRLFVDGRDFGAVVAPASSPTATSGFARIEFTSDGSTGSPLPPGAGSVLSFNTVEIRDSFGRAVLRGTFQISDDAADDGVFVPGSRIEVKGVIQRLPANTLVGEWLVAGKIIFVDSNTRIKEERGRAQLGAYVEVKAVARLDGSLLAAEVEVKPLVSASTAGSAGAVGGGNGGGGTGNADRR
jgi:hypothetical protein